ncbi:hypothetical protein RSOL_225930 [Rhizoctonia solani AG-3 Rhs1AP]|uniref:Transmembrane protein n=2 Tax=Rhizoctonia solani AG-3 TaxID=1086053 RepID=A0A074S392_9AGAM|nr:hypothetical protein RSOL_225930 [Rhizoctonia solani AG-3 Rhs1AP]KEP52035.1 hypothetical protein V565_051620 [Rhizoctonia solani 123E]
MFSKSLVPFVLLAVFTSSVNARMRVIERDGRALYGRRFGQEQNPAIAELSSACNGATCGVLAGKAVGTLLAASPECAQQDLADDIIDAAREQDATTQAKMIDIAKRFRQAEKNTPPDFTTNPPTNRNSVFCQTPPRNAELTGLNQSQDPANNPDDFFDPACKCTVKKGSQANTSPLAGGATSGGTTGRNNEANKGGNDNGKDTSTSAGTATETGAAGETATATTTAAVSETATATTTDAAATTSAPANSDPTDTCPAVATVTVTVDPSAPTATATGVDTSATSVSTDPSATGTTPASPAATAAPANGNIDLGSCSDPTIKFGAGIEGRTETSFIPNNLKEFNHGSAQNSAIITQFVCDTFVNSCKANQAAIDACKQAKNAAAAAGAKKGAAADAFNQVFGVTTKFAAIQALDDQGRAVA